MPLLTGVWKININGTEGDMSIDSVGADGFITGTAISIPFTGFWNESAQEIFFETITPIVSAAGVNAPATGAGSRAHFVGYLFNTPPNTALGSDIRWTYAGT